SELIHPGPPEISKFFTSYAMPTSIFNLAFVAVKRPPTGGRIITMLFPEVFGLTDATSNSARFAGDCAATAPVRTSTTAAAAHEYDICARRRVRVSSILFSDPATLYYFIDEKRYQFV